jgi:hypothetical protein
MGKKDEIPQERKKLRSLHSEMKDRGLVVEASSEKRRKRRDQRRKTGDLDVRALEKLTKTTKSKSRSQNCVSFAKKLATDSRSGFHFLRFQSLKYGSVSKKGVNKTFEKKKYWLES